MSNESATTVGYPTSYRIFWENTCDVWMPFYILVIILYIYVLWVLCSSNNKRHRSCYYFIFIVTGSADIVDAVAIEYIRFSQRVGMGPTVGWLLQITTAITGSNYAMHLIGNGLMSIFQFTAVWFPMFHANVWTKKKTGLILAVMVVTCLAVYGHLLFTEFVFAQDALGRWVYTKRKQSINKTRILDSVLQILQSIISGALCVAVIVGLRTKTDGRFKKTIPEKSLVLVQVISVIFGAMQTLYGMIDLFQIPIANNPVLNFIQNEFVSYFFFIVCLNAITLPLLSETTRTEVAKRWWQKSSTVGMTADNSTTSKITHVLQVHHK